MREWCAEFFSLTSICLFMLNIALCHLICDGTISSVARRMGGSDHNVGVEPLWCGGFWFLFQMGLHALLIGHTEAAYAKAMVTTFFLVVGTSFLGWLFAPSILTASGYRLKDRAVPDPPPSEKKLQRKERRKARWKRFDRFLLRITSGEVVIPALVIGSLATMALIFPVAILYACGVIEAVWPIIAVGLVAVLPMVWAAFGLMLREPILIVGLGIFLLIILVVCN